MSESRLAAAGAVGGGAGLKAETRGFRTGQLTTTAAPLQASVAKAANQIAKANRPNKRCLCVHHVARCIRCLGRQEPTCIRGFPEAEPASRTGWPPEASG